MIIFSWVLFMLFHLFITVILASQFSKYRPGNNNAAYSISIIIAAHNELENLKILIPQLLKLEYQELEIIVSLDRCNDKSGDYLKNEQHKNLKFLEIKETPQGWNSKKYALDLAIQKSKNEWLLFTDADCTPKSTQWASAFSKQIDDKTDILIGYSPYRQESTFLSAYIRFESFVTGFLYLCSALSKRPYMAVGRNMAIRKSFFIASGGYTSFKSAQGGDDDLFIQKNANSTNTKVVLGTDSLVETYPKNQWNDYFKQKLRHLSIGSKYQLIHKVYLSIYHISHLIFWILLFFQTNYQIILSVVLFYTFIKLGSYRFAASKMGAGFNYILLPLVDIMYAILTPVIACWSKLEKDIRWKN